MLEKSNRVLRLKNVQGKNVCVVREVYRRDDIPCLSELCMAGCQNVAITSSKQTIIMFSNISI